MTIALPEEALVYAYGIVALLGASVGSLLNVIIYRLPLMLKDDFLEQCHCLLDLKSESNRKINLFFPRSFCQTCKTTIPFWHNIPILSYLILRGRCHHCHEKISLRYPFVEALTMALSIFAAYKFGFTEELIFALLFIWILIAIFFIDLDHQLIPDTLSLSLLWLGLISNCNNLFAPLNQAVLAAAGAYVGLWLFIKLFYLITGKIGMGNGDFKLFAAFGAWLGFTTLPFILFFSSIIGAVVGISYLKFTKQTKDTPIPFGPFLCVAGMTALFYGDEVVGWYLHCMVN